MKFIKRKIPSILKFNAYNLKQLNILAYISHKYHKKFIHIDDIDRLKADLGFGDYVQNGVPWTTQARAMPLEDFKEIQLLDRNLSAGNWDRQVSDNAPRNLPEPSTEAEMVFMTKGTGEDV